MPTVLTQVNDDGVIVRRDPGPPGSDFRGNFATIEESTCACTERGFYDLAAEPNATRLQPFAAPTATPPMPRDAIVADDDDVATVQYTDPEKGAVRRLLHRWSISAIQGR